MRTIVRLTILALITLGVAVVTALADTGGTNVEPSEYKKTTDTPNTSDDILCFFDGNDLITMGSGNDNIVSGWGPDRVEMGGGDDIVYFGVEEQDLPQGDTDADMIWFYLGNDAIELGNGSDTLDFGSGDTNIDTFEIVAMGPGNNLIYLSDDSVTAPGHDCIANLPFAATSATVADPDADNLLIRSDEIKMQSNYGDVVFVLPAVGS